MPKNVIVAQSGGPSPVINNSLRGVIDACGAEPKDFGRVYAGWHGIEGVLREELLDLSAQPHEEIALLGMTPAAGVVASSSISSLGCAERSSNSSLRTPSMPCQPP